MGEGSGGDYASAMDGHPTDDQEPDGSGRPRSAWRRWRDGRRARAVRRAERRVDVQAVTQEGKLNALYDGSGFHHIDRQPPGPYDPH
jgi:hypothetical protein